MNVRHVLITSFGLALAAIAVKGVNKAALSPPARTFEFNYLVHIPKLPAEAKMLRLWVPLPQSDRYQSIRILKIDSALPYARYREKEYGNEYLYLEAPAAQIPQPFEVQMRLRIIRREHRVPLDPRAARASAATNDDPPADLARFLAPDRMVPTTGIIRALADQETQGLAKPMEKARAIYNYVVSTMRYDKSGEGWGRGDAIFACNAKRGNCTDFHSLFIGMARAAGIPARFEIGFPLPADQHEGAVPGYHCWAEFYLEPYGWVPVDASEAWQNPPQRDYFFGAHDVNRVQFTVGRDIRLQPAQQGEVLNYFIYPYAELDGRPFSAMDYKFSFRDLG
jgi:transglutaminase-like putative cysteine protease